MRVVIRAQQQFNKQYHHYATSLAELVHSGSFTKRMVDPHRGDYITGFQGKKNSFVLTMTPNHLDTQHRSFYAKTTAKSTPTKKNRRRRFPASEVNFLFVWGRAPRPSAERSDARP